MYSALAASAASPRPPRGSELEAGRAHIRSSVLSEDVGAASFASTPRYRETRDPPSTIGAGQPRPAPPEGPPKRRPAAARHARESVGRAARGVTRRHRLDPPARLGRTQARYRSVAGSRCYRPLTGTYAGASIRTSARFLCPPPSSRTAGFPQSGWKRGRVPPLSSQTGTRSGWSKDKVTATFPRR